MPPRVNDTFDPSFYIKMEPGMLCGDNSSYINYSDCSSYPIRTSPEMERYNMALDFFGKDNEDNLNEVTPVFTFSIEKKLTCVKKIIHNGPATIVFWDDGTKTIVKRAKGTKDDIYTAFCAAFAKKMLGSNSRIQRIIEKNLVTEEKGKK